MPITSKPRTWLAAALAWTLAACKAPSPALTATPTPAPAPVVETPPKLIDLREIIEVGGVKSVDALLPLLSDDLLTHPVLLHVSGSKHVATFDAPRIVLHTSDGRMALAFNSGVSGQTGDQSLEIMQFDDETSSFAFSEIKFPIGPAGEPVYSEKDPERCIGCHDLPARPNWASYPTWQGAYGENGDKVTAGSEEEQGLKKFIASYKSHPRYKFLKAVSERYAVDASGKLAAAPNETMLELFARLNVKRIAAEVKAQRAYAAKRAQIVALLSGCNKGTSLASEAAKLSLTVDLADWTMDFLGADDDHRRPVSATPFQDARGDYLAREFFRAMTQIDPDLATRTSACL